MEDTGATLGELTAAFGPRVASLVAEVTDDKSLPKAERKRLQIEHAAHASTGAKMIKIADKTSNLRALAASPPAGWARERRDDYLNWASEVVARCRGANPWLETQFDAAAARLRGGGCNAPSERTPAAQRARRRPNPPLARDRRPVR